MGEFQKRLKEMMEKRGMRQVDLAAKTGLDKAVISSYVLGRYEPKDIRLQLLAAALQCDPLWLAGYDGIVEDEDKEFMGMFRQLGAEDKRTVTKILQYLVDAKNKDDAKA